MLKYPKLPRAGASLATQQNYKRRCDEIDRKNQQRANTYNQKVADIDRAKKLHESMKQRKARGIKVPKLKA